MVEVLRTEHVLGMWRKEVEKEWAKEVKERREQKAVMERRTPAMGNYFDEFGSMSRSASRV